MTPEQVKEFQEAVGTAAWKLDLWKFAEAIGSNADHDYTKAKFLALQTLNRALNQFDAATLAKIINAAQEQPVKVVDRGSVDKWYLGTMNDGLAIIDVPPAPAPVDAVNPNRPAPSLIIPLRHADRVTQEVAEKVVTEHNAALARVCVLLDCPMCSASKAFVLNPLDGAVGYCVVEQMAWRVSAANRRAWTRFSSETNRVVDHLDGDPHNNSLENLRIRNQQGAIQLGALFTALVLIVCSLVIGYVCGRKASCEAPAVSVTKLKIGVTQ